MHDRELIGNFSAGSRSLAGAGSVCKVAALKLIEQGLPLAALTLDQVNAHSVGEFIAFWHLFAVYSSVLRKVNPFDQPQVENSKNISWVKRKGFKENLYG